MAMSLSAVVVFLFVSVAINVGSATTLSQTDPSYVPVCPGDTVIFTCTATTGAVAWSLNSDGSNNIGFDYSTNIGISTQLLMPFTLTLVNKTGDTPGSTLVTTATATDVTYSLTDTSIYCTDDGMNYNNITLTVRNITSLGPPIGLSVTALNDSSVNLTWSPPSLDSICITGYIISRDDIPVTTTSTNTLVLSHLSYGNTYNFTVAAVDKTNTTGNYSQHVIINLSVPNVVRNLNYTSSGDDTITVYWNSPASNYHPDIIHYIIYTNMTDTSHATITSDITNYTLSGVSTRSTYFISVSAVNIIGEGTNNTIYVSLVDVSPTLSSSRHTTKSILIIHSTITDSTSSASIQSASVFISSFDTTHRQSIMTTVAPIVCDTCSSSAVISVGIGVPISVLLSSTISGVITGCIVYFMMRNRRGSTDVKGQHNPVVIYDVPDVQRDIELQANTAYGQVN